MIDCDDDNRMEDWPVTRVSPHTGIHTTITVRVSYAQVERYLNGALIQHAFPQLSDAEREFILTGYTEQDWRDMFGDEE